MQETPTKPYLLRALYEWCTDNGFTPHIAVRVDQRTRVPRTFVNNGEIVLNISFEATTQLQMGNEWIEFSARFSGKSHKIEVPVTNVLAIYARENGQGMAFPVDGTAPGSAAGADSNAPELLAPDAAEPAQGSAAKTDAGTPDGPDDNSRGGKGHLKVIK